MPKFIFSTKILTVCEVVARVPEQDRQHRSSYVEQQKPECVLVEEVTPEVRHAALTARYRNPMNKNLATAAGEDIFNDLPTPENDSEEENQRQQESFDLQRRQLATLARVYENNVLSSVQDQKSCAQQVGHKENIDAQTILSKANYLRHCEHILMKPDPTRREVMLNRSEEERNRQDESEISTARLRLCNGEVQLWYHNRLDRPSVRRQHLGQERQRISSSQPRRAPSESLASGNQQHRRQVVQEKMFVDIGQALILDPTFFSVTQFFQRKYLEPNLFFCIRSEGRRPFGIRLYLLGALDKRQVPDVRRKLNEWGLRQVGVI